MTAASDAHILRGTVVLSAASFAAVGVCFTLPGALLPVLVDAFGIRLVEAGSMLAFQPCGHLLSVLAAARLIGRFGVRAVLAAGMLLFALGLAGFGLVSSWTGAAAMLFLSGLGFGVVEVSINSLLLRLSGARRSNLLNLTHLFFGVGSLVAPVAATQAVALGASWRVTFVTSGFLAAVLAVGWGSLQVSSEPESADGAPLPLRSRAVPLLAAMMAVYVGVEIGIGSWLTKYMVSVRDVTLTYAGSALSLYWLGLTAGRLLLSVAAHRWQEERLLITLAAVAAVAATAALLVHDARWATACFALTGLGFSGIFPGVVALGGRFGRQRIATVTSVMIAGAGVGGIIFPWTMSAIADGVGLVGGMAFYAALCAGMVLLALALAKSLPARTAEAAG